MNQTSRTNILALGVISVVIAMGWTTVHGQSEEDLAAANRRSDHHENAETDSLLSWEEERSLDSSMENESEADDEHWDDDELESLELEIEIETRELRLQMARLESIGAMARVVSNEEETVALVIDEILECLSESEAIQLLEDSLRKDCAPPTRRLVRLKLIRLYANAERNEEVRAQILALITET